MKIRDKTNSKYQKPKHYYYQLYDYTTECFCIIRTKLNSRFFRDRVRKIRANREDYELNDLFQGKNDFIVIDIERVYF